MSNQKNELATLDFYLKGDRLYVQGPDIFNLTYQELKKVFVEIIDLDISFHNFTSKNLLIIDGKPVDKKNLIATCSFLSGGKKQNAFLIESDVNVELSKPYTEESIISKTVVNIEQQYVELSTPLVFNAIETIVSMVKTLHNTISPSTEGKWAFVRGKFNDYQKVQKLSSFKVVLTKRVGKKLTQSAVFSGEAHLGDIYFSLV